MATKSPPAIAPLAATDRTCPVVFGVPWPTMRTWCREHGVTIHRIGRRPMILVEDVRRALEGDTAPAWDATAIVERAARGSR